MLVHLIHMELSPKLQSVQSHYLGNRVAQIQSVVDLGFIRDRKPHDKGGKGNVLHTFKLRRLHHDAGRPRAAHETLRRHADPKAASRLPDHVAIAEKPQVEFIDSAGPESLRVAQADELGPSES